MLLKNNNDSNCLQKSSAEKNKIAIIFYVNATQICKMQFHWSSQMEWPGINQSAFTIQTALYLLAVLVLSATSTQFPDFGHFKQYSSLSSDRDVIFVFLPSYRMCCGTMFLFCIKISRYNCIFNIPTLKPCQRSSLHKHTKV